MSSTQVLLRISMNAGGCGVSPPLLCLVVQTISYSRSFCGVATVETEFDGSGFGPSEVCFEVVSNLPSNVPTGNVPLFLCIEVTPINAPATFLEFSQCAITFNNRRCGRCTVCEGHQDFSFDCSNVNINPTNSGDFIAGPAITTCVGFGTLFGFLGGIVGS